MKKEFKLRYTITGITFTIILSLLVVRLFDLQVVKGETYKADADKFSRKVLRETGQRGKILDSNGLPLAYNKTSYSVEFTRDPRKSSHDDNVLYSKIILEAYHIITRNGGKFLSTFAIRMQKDGSYSFYWPGLDMTKQEDVDVYNARVKKWREDNSSKDAKYPVNKDASPDVLFQQCRVRYGVPADATYEEAFALLSVWQEVHATRYASFIPVVLAQDVSYETVAEVKMSRNELTGMEVAQSSTRVYPNKSMAAHIIGYMNRALDEPTLKSYQDMGYSSDDLVGVAGIEKTMEFELTGNTSERTGTTVVEVDSKGRVVRTIESDNKSPKAGNNVMLTIDSNLQKRMEKALEDNIKQIRASQEAVYNADPSKFADILSKRESGTINWASVGAAVVMNVQTGNVLSLASYPSYDPNLFTGGISEEDYRALTGDNSNNPLFNNAISSRGTPGSIFKLTTGLAALMEDKVSLDEKISCKVEYRGHFKDPNTTEKGPRCWSSSGETKHKDLDIKQAIAVSCNYFFYTLADRVKIDKLNNWADLLGLTSLTGIELPNEIAGQMGNQSTLYSEDYMSGVAVLTRNNIVKLLKNDLQPLGYQYEDKKYTDVALKMMDLVNQNIDKKGPDIRAILKNELKVSAADILRTYLDQEISVELTQLIWSPAMTVESGVGQGVTTLTPIGVARYVSALVNGGNVFEARIVKSVIQPDGTERVNPPKLIRNLNVPEEYLAAIKEGMKKVVSEEEGSAVGYFDDMPDAYKDKFGGKTGTAQVIKSIELENNSWFVAFAPYDKPEIAIVVYIPHGYKGAYSSYTVKQALLYYFDKLYAEEKLEVMPAVNALVQ